jgi:DNA-binding NarL/FixJ family response regulator
MALGSESTGRNAVIISPHSDVIESLVASAGFDVVGAAESAVNGEMLLKYHVSKDRAPDVVVVENDLVGPSGWDSIPNLRAASPTTQVLLVVNEDWTPRDLGSCGAFAVVTRSRLSELVTELDGVDQWITDQAVSTVGDDRRTGHDRRFQQDWSKVGWERRADQRRAA